MPVNHQHLRTFHAIATEGSFSRAARRLNVAQPTLSQQLKALEDRHQASLFDSRKPPLQLTPVGRELFALTQRLFAISNDIDELLGDDPEAGTQVLRLGSDSPVYAAHFAAKLRLTEPGLKIKVRIGNGRETLAWLNDAQVDAALVTDPAGQNHYAYEPVYCDDLVMGVPIAHRLASAPAYPVESLQDDCLLVREETSRTRSASERMLAAEGVAPRETVELHTRETIREAVALGLGVSLFISCECPPDPRVRYMPLLTRHAQPQLNGYLVCLAERRRSRMMRKVLAAAADLRAMSPRPIPAPKERRSEV